MHTITTNCLNCLILTTLLGTSSMYQATQSSSGPEDYAEGREVMRLDHLAKKTNSTTRIVPAPVKGKPHSKMVSLKVAVVTPRSESPRPIAKKAAVRTAYLSDPQLSRAVRELARSNSFILDNLKSVQTLLLSQTTNPKTKTTQSILEVSFDRSALENELQQIAGSNLRIVTLLPEFVDGKPHAGQKVEIRLEQALIEQKFHVLDWNFVTGEHPIQNLVDATLRGQSPAYNQVARWFHANWIIVGRVESDFSQEIEGILSYHSHCDARAINVATGQTIPLDSYEGKGLSDTPQKASSAALTQLANQMAEDVPKRLLASLPNIHMKIIAHALSKDEIDQVVGHLNQIPGVADVRTVNSGTECTFTISSHDKITTIASELELLLPDLHYAVTENKK